MSDVDDKLAAWRLRLALVRQAQKKSAPTGGGGAPADAPVKPPDAPGTVENTHAVTGGVVPSPFTIPEPKLAFSGGKGPRVFSQKQLRAERNRDTRLNGEAAPAPRIEHPKTRGECEGGDRPCPLVGCRHHTAIEVKPKGSLQFNHPDKEVEQLGASCSLDVADAGPITLEQTGAVLNLTRERVRQVETAALKKLAAVLEPKFKGSCKERCANTGLQCRLPAHGPETSHAHERGRFFQVAAPGQTVFEQRRRLDDAASRNPFDDGGVHVRG